MVLAPGGVGKEAAALGRELSRVKEAVSIAKTLNGAGRSAAAASWERIERERGQRFDTVRRWCTGKVLPHHRRVR